MEKDRLLKLVEAYQEHFKQYNRPDYNETEVRNDFVNPFFEILGWDVQNKKNLPQHLREVKHEASVFVEENGKQVKKKPDYEFHVGSTPYFFLETKKPNVDIMTSKEAAFQTRRYGWNGNLEISVLSNFTDLVIYDTSVRPEENDKPSVAQVAHFHFTEYVDKFDEISRLLSYETVISGDFEKTFANISSSLKKEPFDKYFLSQIKKWRLVLSKDIIKHKQIIHFGTEQVFKGRSTYTCLLFIEKNERKTFEIGFVKDINRFYATESAEMKEYPIEYLSAAPWTFLSNEIVQTLEKKRDKCQPLDSLADIFVGLQTSADPIYIIESKSEKNGFIKFIDCNGIEQEIEAAITKPCIYDMQLEKYAKIEENRRIIFPYYQEGKKQVLYSIDEMKQLFPKTLKYFESFAKTFQLIQQGKKENISDCRLF